MYFIRKFSDCWAVFESITNGARKLTEEEKAKVKLEFPVLADNNVLSIRTERIRSIANTDDRYPYPEDI